MKKVFIYCRVSTAQQIDGDGWPRQEAVCRAFADKQGWAVVRVFKEQQTGSDQWSDRKLLTEALELATGAASITDTIIIERADRLSRDLIVSELFLRDCKERGVKVYAADCGEELVNAGADPTRTLIRQILGALAQWDKNVMVRKMQAGRKAKAELTGKPCGGPPPNPYGDRGSLAQKNEERKVLNKIVDLKRQGFSCASIAKHLRDMRIKTPHPVLPPNVPWQWSGKTVERLVNKWMHREEMK